MDTPVSRFITRMAYGARQLPRVAWYVGHSLAVRQLSEATRRQEGEKARRRPRTDLPVPDRNQIYADMGALFLQDLANVEAGIYPMPIDHDGPLVTLLHRSRLFFEDLPVVHERRNLRANKEVLNEETRGKRPRYYLQNFHFQSGGWLTKDSAERYDTQVEVLFNGTANAIRRQALPQLREAFAGRDQRKLRLLDIGCGTGRFIDSVKQVWPRLPTLGLDLSEAYIRHAKRELKRRSWTRFIVGNSEAIPLSDGSQDAVTSIFLFHELPSKIRRVVLKECARVLKPGGRLVLIDSVQRGDRPDYEGMLELFPQNYHEPYYQTYIKEDFGKLAADCGLTYIRTVNAFVSKVMVFDKPLSNARRAKLSERPYLLCRSRKISTKLPLKRVPSATIKSVIPCGRLKSRTHKMATRESHLAEFSQAMPKENRPMQILCEDRSGTYVIPYPCHWSDGAWRKVGSAKTIEATVIGWRTAPRSWR